MAPQTLDLLESWAVGKLGAHCVARVDQHTRSAACHAVIQVSWVQLNRLYMCGGYVWLIM